MRLGLRRLLDHLPRTALFVDDFLEELAHDVVLVLAELDLELRPEQAAPTRFDGELAPAREEGHQFAPVQTVSVSDGQNGVLLRRVLQESSDFVIQFDHAVNGAPPPAFGLFVAAAQHRPDFLPVGHSVLEHHCE